MSEKNDNKQCDLMDEFNNPDYDEKGLFCICKQEVERTISAIMRSLLYERSVYFSRCFLQSNFQLVRIGIYKLYNISLTEEEYDEDNIEHTAKSIIIRFNKLLEEKYKFEDKLTTFISFGYFLQFNSQIMYIAELLKNFFQISKDDKGKYHCFTKHNIELIEAIEKLTEKEPSLRKILNDMYSLKYIEALQKLSNLLGKHRNKYKKLIQNTDNSLFNIEKFFNFVNNYNIRHGDEDTQKGEIKIQKQPTDEQLKVHLDFGLSIYRLFCIYQDGNDKKSAQK